MPEDRIAEAQRLCRRLIAAAVEVDEAVRKNMDAVSGVPADQPRVNRACEELFNAADAVYRRYSE